MMRETGYRAIRARNITCAILAAVTLAACEDGAFGRQGEDSAAAAVPANAPNQRVSADRDIERPDLFEVTDRGLWDGRPSLGGVWVAHPDVGDPERVLVRNTETGETIIGALFRRERDNPGPALQVSSDAAEALGMLAGAPAPLYVVALRRQETEEADENPVTADLAAPVNVAETPLEAAEPVATTELPAATETTAAAAASALVAAAAIAAETPPPVVASPPNDAPVDVSAIIGTPAGAAGGPMAQIGVFSVEANAESAAAAIVQAGLPAEVLAESMGGQTVWRLVAGPLPDAGALATLKGLGFVDAFIIENEQ